MMNKAAVFFLKAYQYLISPLFGPCCRFHPTCSDYAQDAVKQHGFVKALFLITKRIVKCHPFYRGDFIDPVPETFDWRGLIRYNRQSCETKRQPE